MKLRLPQYSGKDYLVLAVVLLPLTLIINAAIFGSKFFSDWKYFLLATALSSIAFTVYFILCGLVAVSLKNRFPKEEQTRLKLTIMILIFVTMTGLFLILLFRGYENVRYFEYRFNERGFIWAYISMAIINIFLTLLMEGISRYEIWKQNLRETDQLKQVFKHSQLQGLKSQVNPHFLFNSLNTLSCLIYDDEEKAEKFLNEMTKVYRYMLRGEDEQLVTLETELKFIDSYVYLLKSRFGDALNVSINVNDADKQRLLPALSLQILIENAFTQNTVSKSSPLMFEISSCYKGCESVMIKHNKQSKVIKEFTEFEAEVDNLVKKYALLNEQPVTIKEEEEECCFYLPLIKNKEVAA
jgi:two-component system LytT family sensor kinase